MSESLRHYVAVPQIDKSIQKEIEALLINCNCKRKTARSIIMTIASLYLLKKAVNDNFSTLKILTTRVRSEE